MKTIIILMLFCITSAFSQKLWEIEVNPNDLLRDVMEIPNSDLLLFTYNTGKLEIRNSNDGSFVNQLIKKPHESGDLRISNTGRVYYWTWHTDTIEFRDIITNEIIIKTSPEIEGLEGNPIFDLKLFQRFELFSNDSKIIGNMVYKDDDDSRNNANYFVIYNLITKEIEYKEDPYFEDYSAISKSYLSPDEKYMIEISAIKSKARLFHIQNKVYSKEFDGENGDRLPVGIFTKNDEMIFRSPKNISIYSFPNLIFKSTIQLPVEYDFSISGYAGLSLCEDKLFINVYRRIEGMQNKFHNWHMLLRLNNLEIIFDSKLIQKSLEYSSAFAIKNCSLLIIDKDFDNRDGVISCYDFNTLDLESISINSNYFEKHDSNINFNSNEFIGQLSNITIYNSSGSNVGEILNGIISQPNYLFQLPELPSGTYYLQCQLPNQNLNFNFVVVR